MTPGQYAYRQYLRSPHWRALRFERLKSVRAQFGTSVCECCTVPFENTWRNGHHIIYRDDWNETSVDEIRMVCVPCHEEIHKLITSGVLEQKGQIGFLWCHTLVLLSEHRLMRQRQWVEKLGKRMARKARKALRESCSKE